MIGVVFVVYFLFAKGKTRQPTKLNVKANEDFKKSIVKTSQAGNGGQLAASDTREPSFQDSKKVEVLEPEADNVILLKNRKAKNLSIYFVYNGHEWECHEVLGVPQGAPLPVVTAAYQELIKSSDASTFEFFESAYQSILKRWKDRL